MRRKVNMVGNGTLTVSLPSKWVDKYKIEKGDEVDIAEKGNSLEILFGTKSKPEVVEIKVKKPKRLISRSIFNLYRKGASEIRVNFDDPEIIKEVYSYLPLLMGFDIVFEGKKNLVLKNVLMIDKDQFEQTLRRYFHITNSLAEQVYESIKSNNYSNLTNIIELESIQNRLYMFLCRLINTNEQRINRATLHYLLVQRLEDIADDYKYICRYISELKGIKVSNKTTQFIAEVNKMLKQIDKIYYSFSIESGKEIIDSKKINIKKGLKLLEEVPKKEIRLIHILNNIIVKIYECSSPIYGLRL